MSFDVYITIIIPDQRRRLKYRSSISCRALQPPSRAALPQMRALTFKLQPTFGTLGRVEAHRRNGRGFNYRIVGGPWVRWFFDAILRNYFPHPFATSDPVSLMSPRRSTIPRDSPTSDGSRQNCFASSPPSTTFPMPRVGRP